MGDFFKSEMVKGDLQEMAELQRFCFQSMVAFPVLSNEKKKEYFETLEALIEKQKIFYARLKLSDDEEAKEFVESMKASAVLLGASPGDDLLPMFNALLEKVGKMKQKLEAEGG